MTIINRTLAVALIASYKVQSVAGKPAYRLFGAGAEWEAFNKKAMTFAKDSFVAGTLDAEQFGEVHDAAGLAVAALTAGVGRAWEKAAEAATEVAEFCGEVAEGVKCVADRMEEAMEVPDNG